MIKKTINLLFHPAILAIPIAIITIFFFPDIFDKYKSEIVKTSTVHIPSVYSHFDLNSDGTTEKMIYGDNNNSHPILIVKDEGKIVDQWAMKGSFVAKDFFIYCDYDGNSITEIFLITLSNDSVFLTGINPFAIGEPPFIKLFIDKTNLYDNRYSCSAYLYDTPNVDNDDYKELVFGLQTGRPKQPRNLYSVDIINQKVKKSPESGASMNMQKSFDLNNDGFNEYMGKSLAYGNFANDTIDYTDMHSWLMVLNKNMEFLFEPKKFGQYKTSLDVCPLVVDSISYLLLLQIHNGTEDVKNKLILTDIKGNQLKERVITDYNGIEYSYLFTKDRKSYTEIILSLNDGRFVKVDANLDFEDEIVIPNVHYEFKPTMIDIDMDGKDEFIFMLDNLSGIVIYRNDFTSPTKIQFSNDLYKISYPSQIYNRDGTPDLYFQVGDQSYVINYAKNPLYPVKYIIWLLICSIIYTLLFLLQKVQQIRAKRKFETERKIAELQLMSIKGQTDPHFTLNLIDSIGNLFYKKDGEKAGYVFGKYAKLLRTTILSSDKISVTVESEIEYVRNYLELEKFRFDNKFHYKISIDDKVDMQSEIPKMLIHTFVENAIKHGLKHKDYHGKLDLTIKKQHKSIEIKIQDNGIGRQKAKEYARFSTGKGLQILNNILKLYYEIKKTQIKYQITDLKTTQGEPDGTLVTIIIPTKTKK